MVITSIGLMQDSITDQIDIDLTSRRPTFVDIQPEQWTETKVARQWCQSSSVGTSGHGKDCQHQRVPVSEIVETQPDTQR